MSYVADENAPTVRAMRHHTSQLLLSNERATPEMQTANATCISHIQRRVLPIHGLQSALNDHGMAKSDVQAATSVFDRPISAIITTLSVVMTAYGKPSAKLALRTQPKSFDLLLSIQS